MKKKVLTIPFIICMWAVLLHSQTVDTFEISGQVINGTQNGVGVANLQVELHLYQENQENPQGLRKTVTDSQGFFKFSELPSKPNFAYLPMARYLEVDYPGPYIHPSQKRKRDTLQLVVYDTTANSENIRIRMEHLLVDVGEGVLKVNEILIMENSGNKTYIGEREISPGQRNVLEFTLPQNAADLKIGQGLMSCCLVAMKEKFYNTMPFVPGTKQVSYSYQLKFGASEFTFAKLLDYDIKAFDLFMKTPGVKVTGPNLKPVGDFRIREESYQRYSAMDLKKHQLLEINFSNLPKGRRNLHWLVMIAVGSVLLFVVAYSLSKRRKKNGGAGKGEKKDESLEAKEELLHAIADLDDRYEKGQLPKEDYQRERSQLKSKLLRLVSQMDVKNKKV